MLMMTSILMRMGAPVGLFHMHGVKLGPDLRFQWKSHPRWTVRMLHVITVTEAVQLPGPLLQSEENRINMERKVDRSRKSKWYHS